ncbi:MAG: 4-hydroxythreonine-4-phosphate dehydrogenase PdxA [Hyphomicrobiaceae bacterium]
MSGAVTDGTALPLAVTMGDPAGIGPEIAVQAWFSRRQTGVGPFVVLADVDLMRQRTRRHGADSGTVMPVDELADAAICFDEHLPVLHVPLARASRPGAPDPANAPAVIAVIERAVEAVMRGEAAAVVTNPIAKSVLQAAGFAHPGHTEFLAALADAHVPGTRHTPVMMIASDALNVVPLTIHIPLGDVPGAVTSSGIVATVRIMNEALRRDFALAAPRIAVAGLNPHAGEDGRMGHEEIGIIAPAIAQLRQEGLHVTGPHPADTLFHAARRTGYDAALCMYHDQALIPVKTLAFDTGVNVTLGLPFVRTSPDHGTAFDIAGTGTASPSSLIAALRLARTMSERRRASRQKAAHG